MNATEDTKEPDPHFGTDEEMLAWCEDEGLQPIRDADGRWDWHAVWEVYANRLEEEG